MYFNGILRKIIYISVLTAPAFITGCSTLVTSDDISFPVKTTPESAQVRAIRLHGSAVIKKIDYTCTSPCDLELRQDHGYEIFIKKKGYKDYKKKISSDASVEAVGGSFLGNMVLMGGLVGMGVDAVSGADDRLFPGHLDVKLIKDKAVKTDK